MASSLLLEYGQFSKLVIVVLLLLKGNVWTVYAEHKDTFILSLIMALIYGVTMRFHQTLNKYKNTSGI